jgi:hypothetical protein
MQDKMLWDAFFLLVTTNKRYHGGLEPPSLWPPGIFELGRNLEKLGPPVLM